MNLVIACSEKAIDSASESASEVDTSISSPPESDPIPKGGIEGQVLFSDGTPAENVMVQMCSSSCYAKVSDYNGNFSFGSLPADQYTMQNWFYGDPSMSTPTAPIRIEEGVTKTLLPWIFLAFVMQEEIVEARSYELDRGLQLSIDPNTLSSGPYSLSEEAILSSVYVDPQNSGIPFDSIDGEVLALCICVVVFVWLYARERFFGFAYFLFVLLIFGLPAGFPNPETSPFKILTTL